MDSAPLGTALTQRMYELRKQGHTMPEVALRLSAEGYTLPGARRPGAGQALTPATPNGRTARSPAR